MAGNFHVHIVFISQFTDLGEEMANIDFDLKLSNNHGYEVELLNSPLGRTAAHQLALSQNLAERLRLVRSGRSSRRDSIQLGAALFAGLFPGRIGEIWQQCKGNPEHTLIRLRLDIRDRWLHLIPWELIREGDSYLALTQRFPIVRFEQEFRHPVPARFPSPLKVLLISATPSDTPPLPGVKWEIQVLTEVLRRAGSKISQFEVVEKTTHEKFVAALEKGFDVVHFMGHGAFKNNRGFLILEDENGKADWCEAETIGDLVRNNKATLMVLNACETAIPSPDDAFIGVAKAVHTAGVPSVVAMQQEIRDSVAPVFAQAFYDALTKGHSLERGMMYGRLASKNAQRNEGLEWAIPALFSNAPAEISQPAQPTVESPRSTIDVNGIYAKGTYGPNIVGDVTNLTIKQFEQTKPK